MGIRQSLLSIAKNIAKVMVLMPLLIFALLWIGGAVGYPTHFIYDRFFPNGRRPNEYSAYISMFEAGTWFYAALLLVAWYFSKMRKLGIRAWHLFLSVFTFSLLMVSLGKGGSTMLPDLGFYIGMCYGTTSVEFGVFLCVNRLRRYMPRFKFIVTIAAIAIAPVLTWKAAQLSWASILRIFNI